MSGATALYLAAQYGHAHICRLLLQRAGQGGGQQGVRGDEAKGHAITHVCGTLALDDASSYSVACDTYDTRAQREVSN
mgnify:CR=1 FL=1